MFALLLLYTLLPLITPPTPDPALLRDRDDARDLTCEVMSVAEANRRRPGAVAPPLPRGALIEREVVLCQERMLRYGLRADADEAVLSRLEEHAVALAGAAATWRPDLRGATWLVEAHHPSPQVSAKLAFATKNALMAEGMAVSDRAPRAGAADVAVLSRMEPMQAYAAACQRFSGNGSLKPGEALLAVMQLDRLETSLHAGICAEGRWVWLR